MAMAPAHTDAKVVRNSWARERFDRTPRCNIESQYMPGIISGKNI